MINRSAWYNVNKTQSLLDRNTVCGIGATDIKDPIFDTYQ